jgi:hypothetical protein
MPENEEETTPDEVAAKRREEEAAETPQPPEEPGRTASSTEADEVPKPEPVKESEKGPGKGEPPRKR